MTTEAAPTYRFRGSVKPSAEVSRPVKAACNAVGNGSAEPSSATLDIFDVIDSWGGWWGISARDVDAALAQVGDVKTLYVRINSPGGEAIEGVAIANLLRAHAAEVRVTVYGMAASAASYIATAGDLVNMAPGSLMFVHDAWEIVLGNATDLRKAADFLDTLSDSVAGLYALKAGGTTEQWRAAMHADTWYTAESAVAAKLADSVGLDPQLPAGLPPVEDDDASDEATVIEIDVEISPAARAAARRFDLSMLPNAPAALAPPTPAEPPVIQSTNPKEADDMSDTLIKGLRERLGVADDADEATTLAALDEALAEHADPAAAASADGDAVQAALATLEADGKVVVSKTVLDELRAGAQAGAAARAKQLGEERDAAIQAAFSAGKISADRKDAWKASWDKDPEGTKADLDSLPARFPVAALPGYASADAGVEAAPLTDDEAGALAGLVGISKEGLLR